VTHDEDERRRTDELLNMVDAAVRQNKLRDRFAMAALSSMNLPGYTERSAATHWAMLGAGDVASAAYLYADAMIEARKR
jgi:hypothetical protein